MNPLSESTVAQMCETPDAAFNSPREVIDDGRLTHRQKAEILESWARACRESATAAETGGGDGLRFARKRLGEVDDALADLATLAGDRR